MRMPPPPGSALRDPIRPPMRGGVIGRNGEVLTRTNRSNEQADQFDLPAGFAERGWSYQWVRASCHGKPDPANLTTHYENGWRPVPSERKPGYFHPTEYKGPIERDGLVLMERPETLTREAMNDSIRAARLQKHNQTASFTGVDKMLDESGAPEGFEGYSPQNDARGVIMPKLKRTLEGVPETMYPQRELAVGNED